MKIRNILAGLLFICVCSLPAILRAQPSAVERFDRTQQGLQMQRPTPLNLSTNETAPETYPGENSDVGPQRILRARPPRKTWFEIVADSQYFYSDNAYLSDKNKVSTTLFVNTIQAAFAPEAFKLGSGLFSPAIGYRSQWFNYDLGAGGNNKLDRLDFNAQTAFINGRYQLGRWVFNAGFDFTRLLDQNKYDEAYREYVPTIGIQRFFPIRDNLLFSAGAQASYHFSEVAPVGFNDSSVNDRFDASLNLSLTWQIMPKLLLQPFYRFQYTHYPHFSDNPVSPETFSRDDMVNSVGASATYYFTKQIGVRIFANYEMKNSDYSSMFEYTKLDAGGGLSLDFRF